MDWWSLACLALLALGLCALAVIDLRTGYLPDRLQAFLAVTGIGAAAIGSPIGVSWRLALAGAITNAAVFAGLRWVVGRIKQKEAMGVGDIKLVAVGGLWLGPLALPYIMAVGGVLTLIGAGVASAMTGKAVWRGEMPLGPGLAAGILGMFVAALAHVSPVVLALR